MKLSMWILADTFSKKYELRHDIRDKDAEISGVRFISEELSELSPEYVYIGKCSEVFSDPDYETTVILVHGHDLMFIEDQSAEDILNETLAAFDYYNSWENSLWAAALDSNPVQSMVDASEEVLQGPLGISDSQGHVIAHTKDTTLLPDNAGWHAVAETKLVPNTYTSSQIRDQSGTLQRDWSTKPQIIKMENNICIGSQIVAGEEIVGGFYLEQYRKEFTLGDVHLAQVFCEVLSSLSSTQGSRTEVRTTAAILGTLLHGDEPSESALAQLGTYFINEQSYQLLAIRSVTSSINIVRKNTLLETIKTTSKDTLSLVYGEDIVCLLQSANLASFLKSLGSTIRLEHYALGISLPLESWRQVFSHYQQAQFALSLKGEVTGIYYFQDVALESLIQEMRALDDTLDLTHPALSLLAKYDEHHDTELSATLERYLNNERNMVMTAEQLCIHRNSMKYRMRRIRDLIDINLDDPRERLYLLLSYYLTRDTSHASEG